MAEPAVWAWRHPKALGAAGRCIGHTDLDVDPRKARRLAHRIRAHARRAGLPRQVWVSPLRRAHEVGRWLARWGWQVRVDARLAELDFGHWDGRLWSDIACADVEAWQADLLDHAPGGAETLRQLAARVQGFLTDAQGQPRQVVTHGGWLNAWLHVPEGRVALAAADWPAAPPHGSLTHR